MQLAAMGGDGKNKYDPKMKTIETNKADKQAKQAKKQQAGGQAAAGPSSPAKAPPPPPRSPQVPSSCVPFAGMLCQGTELM